jgi:uncharacterized protein
MKNDHGATAGTRRYFYIYLAYRNIAGVSRLFIRFEGAFMDLLNHDIAHEFPEHLDKMRALKTSNQHFAKLFSQYDEDNHAIAQYELGDGAISDEGLEELKKKRLKTKDEIYEMLKAA